VPPLPGLLPGVPPPMPPPLPPPRPPPGPRRPSRGRRPGCRRRRIPPASSPREAELGEGLLQLRLRVVNRALVVPPAVRLLVQQGERGLIAGLGLPEEVQRSPSPPTRGCSSRRMPRPPNAWMRSPTRPPVSAPIQLPDIMATPRFPAELTIPPTEEATCPKVSSTLPTAVFDRPSAPNDPLESRHPFIADLVENLLQTAQVLVYLLPGLGLPLIGGTLKVLVIVVGRRLPFLVGAPELLARLGRGDDVELLLERRGLIECSPLLLLGGVGVVQDGLELRLLQPDGSSSRLPLLLVRQVDRLELRGHRRVRLLLALLG
jgi:hypothetical protein